MGFDSHDLGRVMYRGTLPLGLMVAGRLRGRHRVLFCPSYGAAAGPSLLLCLLGGIFALVGRWRARRGRAGQGMVLIALVVTSVAAGFTIARWHAALAAAPVLERRLGPVSVEGNVIAIEPGLKGARVTLGDPQIRRLAPAETPVRVRLRLRGTASGIHIGDRVALTAVLMPPPAPSAPGAYDFARDAWFRQLGGVGFAFGAPRVLARAGDTAGRGVWEQFRAALAETRRNLHARITGGLGGESGAVASALMTGERGEIPPSVMDAMRASGLAHLLAISGLHIGLVTRVLFFGLRAVLALFPGLALRYPIKKWAALMALLGGAGYMLISGATVPTQRAFLMAALVFLAVLVDRAAISMRLVAWVAMVVLLIAPESLLGPSFQMSFAAVIALVATYETLRPGLIGLRGDGGLTRRLWIYILGVALTTLVAGLATAPFAIYHFNRVAAFGLAANLGAVPITALWIMPFSVLGYLLMPFGLEQFALVPMGWGIDAVLRVARAVAAWPGAAVQVSALPVGALVLVSLGGLWLALWRTRLRLAGLVLVAIGIAMSLAARAPDVIVAGDARGFAVNDPKAGLIFAGEKPPRFERETWLRRAGTTDAATAWTVPPHDASGPLSCDASACIYSARGRTVSLIRNPGAALEDCTRADVVVALVPLGRLTCRGSARVIGRFDLWRKGAHAIWLGGRVASASSRWLRPGASGPGCVKESPVSAAKGSFGVCVDEIRPFRESLLELA
jgi:competence protein ComEC